MLKVEAYLKSLIESKPYFIPQPIRNNPSFNKTIGVIITDAITELDKLIITSYLETKQDVLEAFAEKVYLNVIYLTATELQQGIDQVRPYHQEYNQDIPTFTTLALCLTGQEVTLPNDPITPYQVEDLAISIMYSKDSNRGTSDVRALRATELRELAKELAAHAAISSALLDAANKLQAEPKETSTNTSEANTQVSNTQASNTQASNTKIKKPTKEEAQAHVDAWQAEFLAAFKKHN